VNGGPTVPSVQTHSGICPTAELPESASTLLKSVVLGTRRFVSPNEVYSYQYLNERCVQGTFV
jgi:hypothetical protein